MSEQTMSRERATEALWAGLRLVVVDVETTSSREHGTKIVSIAMVTCRGGRVQGQWSTTLNPGVPISRSTTKIHGLRDEDVQGSPPFADVATVLLSALTPAPGETLVLAAHNAAFDIPLVRDEMATAGHTIPEVPVLDTMGALMGLAGVRPAGGRGLDALLTDLGMTNTNPHDARADATATANAAIELLGRAAAAGHRDITEILTTVEATTTLTQAGARPGRGHGRGDVASAPALPDAHTAAHAAVLGATPASRTRTAWVSALTQCAQLRCSHAAARVASAKPGPDYLAAALTEVLVRCAETQDGPGVATILDAAGPILERIGADLPLRERRRRALVLYGQWATLVEPFKRCKGDLCAACREDRPCGLDTWPYHLAGAALGEWKKSTVLGFMPLSGERAQAGAGVWRTWTKAGHAPLADATLWRCYEWWAADSKAISGQLMAQAAWTAGARHPRLTDAYLTAIAAAGRPADLTAALVVADQTLATTPRLGPPEHWRSLQARQTWLTGTLERGPTRAVEALGADGNPVRARRHHPTAPVRARAPRFLRTKGMGGQGPQR
ncbi:MAG TPA: 3'-5' exonuclease [Cellulomonadaceae bacterium]|nr:3'-5' exonuclease [Cellulomonadaceae bacterium]